MGLKSLVQKKKQKKKKTVSLHLCALLITIYDVEKFMWDVTKDWFALSSWILNPKELPLYKTVSHYGYIHSFSSFDPKVQHV